MGQQIQIVAPSQYLERGETVEIPIVLELDKPMSRVRNVTAKFHAAERAEATYTETTTDSDGDTKTQTKTAVEYNTIVEEDFVLHGQQSPGFFGGLMDSMATVVGAGKSGTLDAGRHEFSVQVTIPDGAPPSMEGEKCSVFYKLIVRIDRALAMDPSEEYEFRVVPKAVEMDPQPVVARYPGDDGHGFWDRTFGKQAHLTLVLDKDCAVPGDELECMLGVETETPMKVTSVDARIICVESTRVRSHTDSYTHVGEWQRIIGREELGSEFSHRFTLPVESIGPPSQVTELFDIEWHVEVNLDVPWAADPNIKAPLRVFFP